MAYIKIADVKKTYYNKKATPTEVLKGIDLEIEQGDIYGIIGYSGAGKSTLIRCINGLENVGSGSITIDGTDITTLNEKQMMGMRLNIGMIFQHFNLLRSKNVYDNIALPLRYQRLKAGQIRERVDELLETVGLADKKSAYPSQLSGGQKQRVSIARALAVNPSILLCDEATSALDPQTTETILDLLRKLNQELNLTIVLITHQMNVIQRICNKVAVIDGGKIVEQGNTFDVFAQSQQEITTAFLNSIFKGPSDQELQRYRNQDGNRLLHLIFTGDRAGDSLITNIAKRYDTDINILYGSIEYVENKPIGSLYVTIHGEPGAVRASIQAMQEQSVRVEHPRGEYPEAEYPGGDES